MHYWQRAAPLSTSNNTDVLTVVGHRAMAFTRKGGSGEQERRIGQHGTCKVTGIVVLDNKAVGIEIMLVGVLDGQQQCRVHIV